MNYTVCRLYMEQDWGVKQGFGRKRLIASAKCGKKNSHKKRKAIYKYEYSIVMKEVFEHFRRVSK